MRNVIKNVEKVDLNILEESSLFGKKENEKKNAKPPDDSEGLRVFPFRPVGVWLSLRAL